MTRRAPLRIGSRIGHMCVWLVIAFVGSIAFATRSGHAETVPPTLELASVPPATTQQSTVVLRGAARDTGGAGPLFSQSFDTPMVDPLEELGWLIYREDFLGDVTIDDGQLVIEPTVGEW